jgi:uncharacterized protein (TIGR02266 family)
MSGIPGAERRKTVRYSARFDVRFGRVDDAARAMKAFSVNLSMGGLALKTSQAYAVGDQLSLALTIEQEQLQLAGTVSWVRNGAIGVRFTEMSPETRQKIEAVLSTLRPEPT